MYRGIVDDLERVRSLNGLEEAVTAILVRDQSNLNRFQEFCERRDIGGIVLVGQEHHSDSRTLLARIPDVKGLEYDAVIAMGVNDSFSGTFFNKKLLYLATTRAKHYLAIHWSGRQSEILQSISDRAITQYRR
jgi:DNA helicase IV